MSNKWSTVVVPLTKLLIVATPTATSPVMLVMLDPDGLKSNFAATPRTLPALAPKYAAPGKPVFVVENGRTVADPTMLTKKPLPVPGQNAKNPAVWPPPTLGVMVEMNLLNSPNSPSYTPSVGMTAESGFRNKLAYICSREMPAIPRTLGLPLRDFPLLLVFLPLLFDFLVFAIKLKYTVY
jgi:hypothetical protein